MKPQQLSASGTNTYLEVQRTPEQFLGSGKHQDEVHKKETLILNIYMLDGVDPLGPTRVLVDDTRSHVPQEAKTLVQKLLAWSEVEQLLRQRGDPAVCVEHALPHLGTGRTLVSCSMKP